MRLIHVSDLHFGPHYMDSVGAKLMEAIASLRPEALVITGDLTQRAKQREFEAASVFIKKARAIGTRVVVCPGNHDIALYRFWERLLLPFARYRRYIHQDLDWVETLPGATIVSLNSVRPYSRLVQGRLSRHQLKLCHDAFARAAEDDLRIIALHHPVGMMDQGFHHPSVDAEWRDICGDARLDLILTGHVHQAAVVPVQPGGCTGPLLLLSCGTTTSNRGRGEEDSRNNFHLLDKTAEGLTIESYRFGKDTGFQSFAKYQFKRDRGRFVIGPTDAQPDAALAQPLAALK